MPGPRLAAACAAILWGLTYIMTTTVLPPHPFFVGAVRALGAGAILLAIAPQRVPPSWILRIVILGTLNTGIFFALAFIGMLRMPGGVAATISATSPLITVILAWLVFQQRPRGILVIGTVIGVTGVAMVVLRPGAAVDGMGVLSILTAAASVAMGTLLTARWGRPPGLGLVSYTGWQLFIGGVELLIIALAIGDYPTSIGPTELLGLAFLTLFITALGFVLWFSAIGQLGATRVAPMMLLIPVVAFLVDTIVLKLAPSGLQVVGIAFATVGLLLTQRGSGAANKIPLGPPT